MQSEISTFENLLFRLKEGHLTLATVKRQACLPHHHPWSPKNYDNHKNREGEHCSSGWHNGGKKIMLPEFFLISFLYTLRTSKLKKSHICKLYKTLKSKTIVRFLLIQETMNLSCIYLKPNYSKKQHFFHYYAK